MKLNIKTKLIGGFFMVVGLMVLVGVIGWYSLSTLNAATDHIVHEQLPQDAQLRDLEFQVALQGELYFEYALTLEDEILEEARSHTEIIREEALLLEEELAGEPEMLAQLRQFELEYQQFHMEKHPLDVLGAGRSCQRAGVAVDSCPLTAALWSPEVRLVS